MMTFKQFLAEGWKRGLALSKDQTSQHRAKGKYGYLSHRGDVDGHSVAVTVYRSELGHHNINFGVSPPRHKHYSDNRNNDLPKQTGQKILRHVHQVVSNYIKKSKPKEIWMDGNTDKKRNLYRHYGDLLAKKHNGKSEHSAAGTIVTFKQH
jgi:hypothetical protein